MPPVSVKTFTIPLMEKNRRQIFLPPEFFRLPLSSVDFVDHVADVLVGLRIDMLEHKTPD
jgi:hypothetical protein